ncbi:MAG: PcfK-like family protein [Oscillospiraceae bacterium]|jgi:hypothetical protein|nr:PcfK-like family protein [Oscillospiraceae bacterium]
MSRIDEAIAKINGEMQADAENRYLEIVGQYIIDRVRDEAAAGRVLDGAKSLDGACKAIEDLARKNKRGRVGVVSDTECFAAVDTYFGFGAAPAEKRRAARVALEDFL